MKELIDAALLLINLPFTVLLVLVVIYWLTVIIGAVDMHSLDFDVDADIHADADVHTDVDAHAHAGAEGLTAALKVMYPLLSFANVGKVPFMVVFSLLILFMWMGAIMFNYYLNSAAALLLAALLLIPNFFIATLLTKIFTTPLVPLFKALNTDEDMVESVVGEMCTVILTAGEDQIGQAEVVTKGAYLLVNVKPLSGEIKKGAKAIIVKKSDERDLYLIDELKE